MRCVAVFAGVLALSSFVLTPSAATAADWPAFRGPTGLGTTTDAGFPLKWSRTENVKWRAEMPIRGNESPIVSNGRVFVTSATNDGQQRRLHCLDRADGKELWVKTVAHEEKEPTHQTNPFGAATPASDGEHVVVWHGTAGLFCYDHSGEQIWKADLGKVGHIWGYGSSPVIFEDRVYLNFGPGVDQFLVAVDLKTGDIVWKFEEPGGNNDRQGRMAGSWSTPVLVPVGSEVQLVCSLPTRVVGLDPKTGKLLWWCDGLKGRNGNLVYTSPLIGKDIGVAMGGYTGPALAFKLGGEGDITQSGRLWHDEQKHPQRIGSGVIVGDHIFMANAGPGTFQCLELKTGKELWKDRGPGGNHWGAMVFADNRLYVTNQNGTTIVFAPDATGFKVLAENSLGEKSNSTPAFSDGEIFLRTNNAVYCVAASTD